VPYTAIPAGFFLGGAVVHGADPGLGILLVPLGALLLLLAGGIAAGAVCSRRSGSTPRALEKISESSGRKG
jgi:hypothetical protein